jgi:hypothetical protein
MATVIGESGAWRELSKQLGRSGFQVQQPTDIDLLLTRLRDSFRPSVEQKKSEIAQFVGTKERSIATLQAERGIWRSFINWFRIRGCRTAISHLHSEERQYIAALSDNIRKVDALHKSAELAGARAELEVISRLARLSPGHTVFNDLRLIADRYIHFNGAPLQSAQIDHLVLSSAGVFVIETKRWSKRFVESGEYHDPYDQIQRAAYLCYDLLRAEFGKIRVRSVIACAGQLPSAPKDSHVKVLAIPELVGYISWFKQTELAADRLLRVRRYLEGFRAT